MNESESNRVFSTGRSKDKDGVSPRQALRARLPGWNREGGVDPAALRQLYRRDLIVERNGQSLTCTSPSRGEPKYKAVLNEANAVVLKTIWNETTVVVLKMSSKETGGFVRALKAAGVIQKGQLNPMTRPSPAPPTPTRRRPMRSPWPSKEADDRTVAHLESIRDEKRRELEAALKDGAQSVRVKSLKSEFELAEADVLAFAQLRSMDH